MEDRDRIGEAFDPVLAQLKEVGRDLRFRPCADERVACLLRKEHLPAITGGRDPGAKVDIGPDVAFIGQMGGTGVHAHAHGNRPILQ